MDNMSKREAKEVISILLATGKLRSLLESIHIKLGLIGHIAPHISKIAFRYSKICIAFSSSFTEGTNTPVPLSIVHYSNSTRSRNYAVLFYVKEIRDDLCNRMIMIADFINAIKKMVGVDAFQEAIEEIHLKTTLDYWNR